MSAFRIAEGTFVQVWSNVCFRPKAAVSFRASFALQRASFWSHSLFGEPSTRYAAMSRPNAVRPMPRAAVLAYDGTRWHSGGVQALKTKKAAAGGEALERFRQNCTDAVQPLFVRVDLRNAPGHGRAYSDAHSRLRREFGEPRADFGRQSGGMSNWFLKPTEFLPALRIVDDVQPIPVDGVFGILSVEYKIEFRFLDMSSRRPLPFQEREDYVNAEADFDRFLGKSFLSVEFSTRHTASSFFSLPFEDWNDDVAAYVRFIQAELPFRISDRRWKRWQLNKAGTRYFDRKISVSWGSPSA